MAKTSKLSTGNSKATKPSATVSYVVTQESFDAAFHAGRAVAGAFQAAAAALSPLLSPLSGKSDAHLIAQWNEYRRAFALGMAAERSIDPDSARRMFVRIVEFLCLVRPQSETAKAKAAARGQASAADKAAARKAKVASMEDAGTPKDGAGADAAATVKMVLSEFEARVIGFLRAGKPEMAAEAIAAHSDAE
jgi:hypothetical protein